MEGVRVLEQVHLKLNIGKLLIVTVFTYGMERTTSRIKHRLSAQLVVPILEISNWYSSVEGVYV